jgi:hypothetical protein
MSTISIPCGEDVTALIKKRFPSTALARLSEDAPTITQAVTDHIVDHDKRQALMRELEGVDDPDTQREAVDQYQREQTREFVDQGLELVRAPVAELDALHEFCVTVTESVRGAEKLDGEPLAWKDADHEARKAFYDCDVPTMTKLTIYVFAWMLKNGVDPDKVED